MKEIVLLTIILCPLFLCPIRAQDSKSYDFINFLIENDSSLMGMKLSPNKIPLYNVCDDVEGALNSLADPFKDSLFLNVLQDTSIDSEVLLEALEGVWKRADRTIVKLFGGDSFCFVNRTLIEKQVVKNNKKRKHKVKYIYNSSKVLRKQTRKSYSYYALSNPIFIDSLNIVLIKIYYHYAPLWGRGYFRIYKKTTLHKWEKIVENLYLVS